jgi:hypothetical protein
MINSSFFSDFFFALWNVRDLVWLMLPVSRPRFRTLYSSQARRETQRALPDCLWSTWVPLVTACCAEPEVRTQYLGQVLLPGYLACAVCVRGLYLCWLRTVTHTVHLCFFVVCALLMHELR